ncbi:MAG: hypothetical protein ACK53Y_13720, partial [bacterium]
MDCPSEEASRRRGPADQPGPSEVDAQACQQQPRGRRKPHVDAVGAGTNMHADGASRGCRSHRSESGEQ